MLIRTAVVSFASFLLIATPKPASADCGFDGVTIEGTAEQVEDACRALGEVGGQFAEMGFEILPRFHLVFRDRVMLDSARWTGSRDPATDRRQVCAFFNAEQQLIAVTSATSPHRKDRSPWGIEWGPEIAYSILQHELAHMATHAVLGSDYASVSRPWLELIAYAIEFRLMESGMREQILSSHQWMRPFKDFGDINIVSLSAGADRFGLKSYLYVEANGGLEFIRRLLNDETDFSMFRGRGDRSVPEIPPSIRPPSLFVRAC